MESQETSVRFFLSLISNSIYQPLTFFFKIIFIDLKEREKERELLLVYALPIQGQPSAFLIIIFKVSEDLILKVRKGLNLTFKNI